MGIGLLSALMGVRYVLCVGGEKVSNEMKRVLHLEAYGEVRK